MRANLKAAILTTFISQRRLAQAIGMRENRLSAIVVGWIEPTLEERRAIAAALRRSPRGSLFKNFSSTAEGSGNLPDGAAA
jgi:hypothetical protein